MMLTTRRSLVLYAMAAPAAIVFKPTFAIGSEEPVTHEVRIVKFKFVPETLQVKVGDTIKFTNEDIAPHTATANDKSWNTKRLKKGKSASIEVTENFSGSYTCQFHPKMKAQIEVLME